MKKIVYYRKCLTTLLSGKYEWSAAVWFNTGIFADATIEGRNQFETIDEAVADMKRILALFGVTNRTPSDGHPTGNTEKPSRKHKKKKTPNPLWPSDEKLRELSDQLEYARRIQGR